MDIIGTLHMNSWALSAAVGIPLVFTVSQFRVGAQSRRSIVLNLNCTSRHCRRVSTGQSDLLRFNSVTGQVGFGKRTCQIYEAQMIFTSNVVSKKAHFATGKISLNFICHHLKLCARKHLWQHPECRPCLTLLTPSVKMSLRVWISRPDTERSHHPPECSHTGNLNSHSRQPRADYISTFKPGMMDLRGNSPLRRQVEGPQI